MKMKKLINFLRSLFYRKPSTPVVTEICEKPKTLCDNETMKKFKDPGTQEENPLKPIYVQPVLISEKTSEEAVKETPKKRKTKKAPEKTAIEVTDNAQQVKDAETKEAPVQEAEVKTEPKKKRRGRPKKK